MQTTLGISSPSVALNTTATLAQVIAAAASAATGENKTSLAIALNALKSPLQLLGGTVRLGDLLQTDGALGNTRVNVLELVTGAIQLYNTRNVLSTPSTLTVSGASLGLSGIATQVTFAAQVVEPPVFVCGPTGSSFHSATIRLKLGLDLLSVSLDVALLKAIPGVGSTVAAQIGHLDLYLEVARADGIITTINAIANAFTVQVTPGVADLYLGLISDNVFFNRGRALTAADVSPAVIGSLTLLSITVDIRAKAIGHAGAASPTPLSFSGTYPQGQTASAGAGFVTTLLSSLGGSLQLSVTAGLGLLQASVEAVLGPIVSLALPGVLQPVIDGLINPVLGLLGVRLGEVDVNAGGTIFVCSISGSVYDDANHSARLEAGETGTGVALYAKLVPSATPAGPALAVATVDTSTGAYSFTGISAASYLIVINASSAAAQVTAAVPSGWIGTESPTLSLAATLSTADLSAQRFGLYHGSKVTGTIFRDNGIGAGTANNGLQDGGETPVVGMPLRLTNGAGNTLYDSSTSGNNGAYTLWLPYTAGAVAIKLSELPAAEWIAVSGSAGNSAGVYSQPAAAVTFTNAVGTVYSGLNFGNVPANRFEPDGQQQVKPGKVAFFTHAFTAGSAGQLGLIASSTAPAEWVNALYLDANCNGKLDSGETALAASIAVVASQKLCVIAKVSAPASAAYGAQYPLTLSAHFAYANNTLASDHVRNDLVIVGNGSDTGLRLSKVVDKAAATSGDLITYTVSYVNQSDTALTAMKIIDATPAYTVFAAASCGSLPNAALTCTVTTLPAVGVAGRLEWTFGGSLSAGATGSVSFSVTLQ